VKDRPDLQVTFRPSLIDPVLEVLVRLQPLQAAAHLTGQFLGIGFPAAHSRQALDLDLGLLSEFCVGPNRVYPEIWIYERLHHRGCGRDPAFCVIYNSLG
jgi:hypothetical protein